MNIRISLLPPLIAALIVGISPPGFSQDLVIKGGTYVKLDGSASLVVQEDLASAGTYTDNASATTVFSNSSPAMLTGVVSLSNAIKRGTGDLSLDGNLVISGSLTFNGGNILTGTQTFTLGNAATLDDEHAGSYLVGHLATVRAVGTGGSALGGIGVTLSAGVDDIGQVSIDRFTGSAAIISVGSNTSIARMWKISSSSPPVSGRTVTLSWLPDDDNGKILSTVYVWKSTDNGGSWYAMGPPQDASSSRVVTVSEDTFGWYTVGDAGCQVMTPPDISQDIDAGQCGAYVTFPDPSSNSLCGTFTFDPPSAAFFTVGTHTVHGTTSSGSGFSFTVTVTDNIPPLAVSKNITVPLDENGQVGILPGDVDDGSSDVCGIASMSVSPNSFNCSNVGPNTVTLSVTDMNNNSSTAQAVVNVEVIPPAITEQPSGSVKCLGESATFSVTSTNVVLGYQWRKNGIDIPNATASSYSISSVGLVDAGPYDVVLSGICGVDVVSEAAMLSVVPAVDAAGMIGGPTIVCAGTLGDTYSIAPVSGATQYDWTVPSGATIASGAGTASISVDWGETAVSGTIGVLPRNDCFAGTPASLAVTVYTRPVFTLQPQDQIVLNGTGTTFTVAVTGDPTPTLQWQMRQSTASTWTDVPGATGTSISVSDIVMSRQGEQYRVQATNFCGVTYSDEATITTKLNLADLGPMEIFLGADDEDSKNRRVDILVEIYKNNVLIGTANTLYQKLAGPANSKRVTVPLSLNDITFLGSDEMRCKVFARKADNDATGISMRFWYDGQPQGNGTYSRIQKIKISNHLYEYYYLRNGNPLYMSTTAGSSDVYLAGTYGTTYQHVGTWSIFGAQMKRTDDAIPGTMSLQPNYPNPFNEQTSIRFNIPEEMTARLRILDALGRIVDEYPAAILGAGQYTVLWQPPAQLPSGMYTVHLTGRGTDGRESACLRTISLVR